MKNTRIVMRKERGTSYCHLSLIKIKKETMTFSKIKDARKTTLNYTCILRLLVFFFQHQKS